MDLVARLLSKIYLRRLSPYCYSTRYYSNSFNALINLQKNLGKKKCIIKGFIPINSFQYKNIDILINILERDILDKKFISIIKNALFNGYYKYYNNNWYDISKGRFTYNIINKPIPSSLFNKIILNIYLREFDTFIHKLQNDNNKFFYVRYNDEFIIGLNDDNISTNLTLCINEFISNRLCLNHELSIYNIFYQYVEFLGYMFIRKDNIIKLSIPTKKITRDLESNFF